MRTLLTDRVRIRNTSVITTTAPGGNVNLLDKLPLLDSGDAVESFETNEVESKKARIQFHRDRVRNGPVNFKEPTSGQIRRAAKRELDGRTRKARRAQVRGYFAARREASTLLGHLQAAGVIAYASHFKPSPEAILSSFTWLVSHFAEGEPGVAIEVTREVVVDALTAALNRYQALNGQPATPLSPAYVLPVQVAA